MIWVLLCCVRSTPHVHVLHDDDETGVRILDIRACCRCVSYCTFSFGIVQNAEVDDSEDHHRNFYVHMLYSVAQTTR